MTSSVSNMNAVNLARANGLEGFNGTRSRGNSRSPGPNRSRTNTRLDPIKIPQVHVDPSREVEGEVDIEDGLRTEDAQSVVGFSIGPEQTRLMSPTTPAAERSAALDRMNYWGFFDATNDEEQEDLLRDELYSTLEPPSEHVWEAEHKKKFQTAPETPQSADSTKTTSTPDLDSSLPRLALPTPWTAAPKRFWVVDDSKFKGRQSPKNRSRATSAASMLGDLNLKRFIPGLLPSHKPSSKGSPPGSSDGTLQEPERPSRSNSLFAHRLQWTSSLSLRPRSREQSPNQGQSIGHRRNISSPLIPQDSPPHQPLQSNTLEPQQVTSNPEDVTYQKPIIRLRRSASHDSVPQSALSRVSSLEDDSRWDHIDGQVNTRVKAIKDSIQDSLPSLPIINFSALRPDFTFRKPGDVQIPKSLSTVFPSSGTRSRANSNTSSAPSSPHKASFTNPRFPALDSALEQLTGDIVVLGGYRGSVLRSAEPPNRQLWVPIKVGLNMRKVDLEVGLNPEDEETMEERIIPSGMLSHIGPIDISRRLFKRLRSCRNCKEGRLRVHDWGYDWRLSPALLSRKFLEFLESLRCNRGSPQVGGGATVIAHSLGGLITRYAVNQKPDLFAGVVYAGTPQHCVNILGPFRNGDEVLLSSKVLTAQVNFTIRTSFALLPESGQCFLDKDTKEQYHVDFFDVESWKRYAFSPCISQAMPALSQPEQRQRSIFGSISGTLSQSFASNNSFASTSPSPSPNPSINTTSTTLTAADLASKASTKADDVLHPASHTLDMSMSSPPPPSNLSNIPYKEALAYLERTLRETLAFKRSLAHKPDLQFVNAYPPHAVIYSTSIPTVYGARVCGREGIKCADAYDNLAFASGDGVVLARAAMLPRGYKVAESGRVRTERGHVGMLGDLEAVGRALGAVLQGRREGVGLGPGFVHGQDREVEVVERRGRTGGDGRGDGRPF